MIKIVSNIIGIASLISLMTLSSSALAFEQGDNAKRVKEYEKAIEELKKELESPLASDDVPKNLGLYYLNLGIEKINGGEYDEALSALEEGEAYLPEKRDFKFMKGLSYFLKKSY